MMKLDLQLLMASEKTFSEKAQWFVYPVKSLEIILQPHAMLNCFKKQCRNFFVTHLIRSLVMLLYHMLSMYSFVQTPDQT